MSEDALIIAGAVVAVALVAIGTLIFLRKSNAEYSRLWGALAPQVNGTVKGNSLQGTYQGMPVRARITAVNSDSSPDHYQQITLTCGTGKKSWTVEWGKDKLLGGSEGWQVRTRDEALKQKLRQCEVVAALANQELGYPVISFKTGKGVLKYRRSIGEMYDVPSPAEFQEQLELLAAFAQANRLLNNN